MERLQKIPLGDGITLIVESTTHHRPELGQDAYFAGIWSETDGPLTRKWIPVASPAEALEQGRDWAQQWLEQTAHNPAKPSKPRAD